jgi:hypothetical protein
VKNKSRKIILVLNPDKVELLSELGFAHNGTRDIGGGNVAYQYIVSDELYKVLKRHNFSRNTDYCEDVKLTF